MSSITWKDSLKTVFEDFGSAAEIEPTEFHALLRGKGIAVHEDIEEDFRALKLEEKKEVIKFLWGLARLDELPPEERRALYARVARHYEILFEWEDVRAPGWIILPGPIPP